MTRPFADLVLPAIRWDEKTGYEHARADIEKWQKLGVGGFILFGGERAATTALTKDLRDGASGRSLLIASDLERGAGQQVKGLTSLPPLAALATLGIEAITRAATITAQEARAVGINWALAPVCDLDLEPRNPIVQTRAFGSDAFDVAFFASSWAMVCQAAGVLACAKHFPGHGRTTLDSHATLPVVSAGRELERDLMPFRRVIESRVATVMTAHVAFPAWDPSGVPATQSRTILREVLRKDLFFDGLIVTDALIMEGAKAGGSFTDGAMKSLLAGCDLLLYPPEPGEVIAAMERAAKGSHALEIAIRDSALRRERVLMGAAAPGVPDAQIAGYPAIGAELCRRSIKVLRGDPPKLKGAVWLEIVDDDAGGPYPLPPRDAFARELVRHDVAVLPNGQRVVLLFADVKSWKGRAGLSPESQVRLKSLVDAKTTVIVFGHPRRQVEIPGLGPVVCAWSGDEAMQRAAAQAMTHVSS
ncbi:MAG TPA: glycoside hydrolase family 3 N-terminal domain-containing protein [Gemmatimonadales bacterium]|jgi:beta-glucosidase-like glycosyl hydrolase